MYPMVEVRKVFNLRLTASQRASLAEITSLLSARCKKRATNGDVLSFLRDSISRAAPGLPSSWANALASYAATEPNFGDISGLANSTLIMGVMMAMFNDAKQGQADQRKEVQAASAEAAIETYVSLISLNGPLLRQIAHGLRSKP
jgi:hypothetical protein